MIGKTISHYKILEKLGEGGMGVVYRAEDTKLERFVAIKVLPAHMTTDEDAKTRFVREARAASALEHPNICHIHEIGETPDGHLYMVMPCYEGETLRERLDRSPLEIDEVLDIITQVVSALSRAHEKGIVHRDIKPGNVMLTDDGRQATLMDFGLAKKLDATKVTRTGTAIGTVAYMSPEQSLGKEADQRTDIWSLGVVLYEMLTSCLPFQGEYEPAVLYSIMNEEPEPVTRVRREVPPGVENVVEKALIKDATKRYQTASELLADLEEQRDRLELGIKQRRFIKIRKKTRSRILRIGLPAFVVAAAVFVLFVVQPFELEIRPRTKEAIAQENSMAIMFFENLADPQDTITAEIVTSALIADLGESEYIRVLSEQRKYDILRELEKKGFRTADRSVVKEVAKLADVNWIGIGKIYMLQPNVVLDFVITHAETGELRNAQRIVGEAGDDILAVVDKLTSEIRADLSLPAEAIAEADRSVAEMMTESLDAYRYYLEGLDYFFEFRMDKAMSSFRNALEYDSTFALAYFRIAMASIPEQDPGFGEAISNAVKYSNKVPAMEKQFIVSMAALTTEGVDSTVSGLEHLVMRFPEEKEAHYWLGILYTHRLNQPEKSIEHLLKALELDPNFAIAYNDISYPYYLIGDLEKALWALNQNIFLAPDDANPHDSKGLLLAEMGELDKAIESFQKALEIDSDFTSSHEYIGIMYLFKKDYAKAEVHFRKVLAHDYIYYRSWARRALALIPIYQGRFDDALGELAEAIAADAREDATLKYSTGKFALQALIHLEMKEIDHGIAALDKAFAIIEKEYADDKFERGISFRDIQVQLLAEKGNFTKAQEIADMIYEAWKEGGGKRKEYFYWYATGLIEYARGNVKNAIEAQKKANDEFKQKFYSALPSQYALALAYIESDNPDQAIQVLEEALSAYSEWMLANPVVVVKAYYLLGRAYEQSGKIDEAIEKYEEFLEIWKDADPYLEEVPDARQRLVLLKESK